MALSTRALASLQRLGAASPLKDAQPYYDSATTVEAERSPRLLLKAQEKFCGELLLEQGMTNVPLELLLETVLNTAAARGNLERAPKAAQAGVWVYAEAVPNGWLAHEEAALVMRSIALAQALELPTSLLEQLLEDVRGFVGMAVA
ncbi:hypothetical protein [Candidatus Thiothrix anitrata]|uniref:Uncharacterized protein n=1 Tax=Candidatus Thiothrix anitrata TaxID=2823902 RepID=A0ABX7X1S9_9GAMM|nr:hypothetical protein [Candidatus Thiothrix anitrata]QTR49882.1 hypothetical protein J8380_16945 [Candidatus Thiothrix anitrata]